jgi:RNA polymerase sigma-70 factor (ECF subfamily)
LTREEFKYLFNAHFEPVRNYIYYRSGDKELANDIAQETFLRYWEKMADRADGIGNIRGLLYKIAGDLFVTAYRKKQLAVKYPVLNHQEVFFQSPEEEMTFKETMRNYENALATLPEKQRTVFLLHRMDGLKYHEIASNLGLSVKAVEKRMKFALEYLRRALNN